MFEDVPKSNLVNAGQAALVSTMFFPTNS